MLCKVRLAPGAPPCGPQTSKHIHQSSERPTSGLHVMGSTLELDRARVAGGSSQARRRVAALGMEKARSARRLPLAISHMAVQPS